MMIHELFPTAVGIFEYDKPIFENQIEYVNSLEKKVNVGNHTSVSNEVLKAKVLKDISKFIENSVGEYFSTIYQPKNKTSLKIIQSWSNYSEPGQYHHKHEHPNSFISGVFYLQTNPNVDKIYFYKSGYQQLKTPTENWNKFNSESWWLEAPIGRLFLFPSSLTHILEPVPCTKTRISISFNTFTIGNFGEVESKTGLTL